jgi:hypothetical protein|tara:strand:- start:455 stop:601 length:147 start_codon:yes stop_codon:yes gene_type:complete
MIISKTIEKTLTLDSSLKVASETAAEEAQLLWFYIQVLSIYSHKEQYK